MVVSLQELDSWVKQRSRMQPATKENFEKLAKKNHSNVVVQLLEASFFPSRFEIAKTPDEARDLFTHLQEENLEEQGYYSFKLFVAHDAECADKILADFKERYVPRPRVQPYKPPKPDQTRKG